LSDERGGVNAPPIRSVLVAGGGIAGWSAAVALRKRMPELDVAILDIPPPAGAMIDAVGAMLPSARGYHGDVAIPEAELIRTLGASIRLGTLFDGWGGKRAPYVHAYGDYGRMIGAAPFHLHWVCAAKTGKQLAPFDHYSPAAAMARAGRFAPPPDDPGHPMAGYEYGLHIDPRRYRAMLRSYATHLGVVRHEGAIGEVRLDPDDGRIASITVDGGGSLSADLYVDASGPERTLHHALGATFEDWSRWLFVDRFLVGETPRSGEPPILDRVAAHAAGWLWTGGSLTGTQHGFAYAAGALSDARAVRILRGATTLDATTPPAAIAPGRVAEPWLRNCVAIGDAAVTSEPLEFTGLHLAHSAIDRILAKLPATDFAAVELWDYNRETNAEADRVRDFLIAHYHVADRPGDPLWRDAARATPPDSLAHTLSLFAERGRLPLYAEETFSRHSWAAVLLGQGLMPRRVDGLASTAPAQQVEPMISRLPDQIAAAVAQLPPHGAYLRHILDGARR
jgi:tryptophan halogenase